jgi:hypothetical protein
VLLRWFPERQFVLAGDQNYGSHEMAMLTPRSRARLHVVSKFYPNANLYEPPPAYADNGRPRVKGEKLPTPQEVVATAQRTRLNVAWYGGGRRDVAVVSGTGHWYKAGEGLVPRAVGVRARPDRYASGRVLLQHGPDHDGSGNHRGIHRALGHRNHL